VPPEQSDAPPTDYRTADLGARRDALRAEQRQLVGELAALRRSLAAAEAQRERKLSMARVILGVVVGFVTGALIFVVFLAGRA
jgi:hypothetical protein